MGKSLPSTSRIQDLTRIVSSSSERLQKVKPRSQIRVPPRPHHSPEKLVSARQRVESERVAARVEMASAEQNRKPLSVVVGDCVKRWFHDAHKEAMTGDTAMQVLVGQMYYNGYGVPKDPHKGRAWITRASKSRSSVWRVCDKQPGYNASDSDSEDSEEVKDEKSNVE